MDVEEAPVFRTAREGFRWDGVSHQPYKQDGEAPFKDISRQILFHEDALNSELRYFEMDPNGYSTLERHEHAHAVMILRGRGQCMVGGDVRDVKQFDLIAIPAWTWHQFRANAGEPFGFLCMVNTKRDRPVLPNAEDLAKMRATPSVAAFLDGS
jgi:quercetin dioxygenase-like cupin family protein